MSVGRIHHAVDKRLALFLLALFEVEIGEGVEGIFMAGVEPGAGREQGFEQRGGGLEPAVVLPCAGDMGQFLRIEALEGQSCVIRERQRFQHIAQQRGRLRTERAGTAIELAAALLVLQGGAAGAGTVPFRLGHRLRSPVALGTRRVVPDFAEDRIGETALAAWHDARGERRRQRRKVGSEGFESLVETGRGQRLPHATAQQGVEFPGVTRIEVAGRHIRFPFIAKMPLRSNRLIGTPSDNDKVPGLGAGHRLQRDRAIEGDQTSAPIHSQRQQANIRHLARAEHAAPIHGAAIEQAERIRPELMPVG